MFYVISFSSISDQFCSLQIHLIEMLLRFVWKFYSRLVLFSLAQLVQQDCYPQSLHCVAQRSQPGGQEQRMERAAPGL